MGNFNILMVETVCNNCGGSFGQRIQFRFGEVWQYVYRLGDKLKRGNAYHNVGAPEYANVKAFGTSENSVCALCGFENKEEYDVLIAFDIVKGIEPMLDAARYAEDNCYDYFVDE